MLFRRCSTGDADLTIHAGSANCPLPRPFSGSGALALPFKGRGGWGWVCSRRLLFRRHSRASGYPFCSCSVFLYEEQSFRSPAGSGLLFGIAPKSNQKGPAPDAVLCTSKESYPLGRRPSGSFVLHWTKKEKLDSSLRWNDEPEKNAEVQRHRIPAVAGMTNKESKSGAAPCAG
jgi:hypothetical protein